MLKLGRLYCISMSPRWENVVNYLHGIKLWNNLQSHRFLYSISRKYCTKFKPHFLTESTYFHHFPYIYLTNIIIYHDQHTANELTFMLVHGYGRYFTLFCFVYLTIRESRWPPLGSALNSNGIRKGLNLEHIIMTKIANRFIRHRASGLRCLSHAGISRSVCNDRHVLI